jgi:hypothetical protein
MRGNFSFAKRKKELERKEKQKKKAERKAQRVNRSNDPDAPDPDLEGQVVGPQPGQDLNAGEEGAAEIEDAAEDQESEADAPETKTEPGKP